MVERASDSERLVERVVGSDGGRELVRVVLDGEKARDGP